jgi:hypothetical protein
MGNLSFALRAGPRRSAPNLISDCTLHPTILGLIACQYGEGLSIADSLMRILDTRNNRLQVAGADRATHNVETKHAQNLYYQIKELLRGDSDLSPLVRNVVSAVAADKDAAKNYTSSPPSDIWPSLVNRCR